MNSDQEKSGRVASAPVEGLIIGRWSPRSFSSEPLSDSEVASLFEGARWAPSSFNRQPWLFLYETDGPDRPLFDSVLMPGNRAWAEKAPLVGFIYANTRTPDGREPRTAQFDTGAAWMALALQARALGLYTHAMAGIDMQAAHDRLGVDAEHYTVMCGFAAGRIGPPDALPGELREREQPNDRKPLADIAHRGILRGDCN
jgi:nitroreductase